MQLPRSTRRGQGVDIERELQAAERIARTLGGHKAGPQWMARCVCHDDGSPSLSLRDGDGCLLVHCFAGCDGRDILAELQRRKLFDDGLPRRDTPLSPMKPKRVDDDNRSVDFALALFAEAIEPRRGPVEVYLASRGLHLPDEATDIRFHPRCPRGSDRLPAMVALMRDALTDRATGIHRTYLRIDGTAKADVAPAKMMLGRAAGSVVKLTPDEEVTSGLGLSEGIEDGLAIINSEWRPIWSSLSAGGMSAFPVLRGIEALTLFSDADAPGLKAAEACAAKWRGAAKVAAIVEPRKSKDFAAMAEAARNG